MVRSSREFYHSYFSFFNLSFPVFLLLFLVFNLKKESFLARQNSGFNNRENRNFSRHFLIFLLITFERTSIRSYPSNCLTLNTSTGFENRNFGFARF